MLFSKKYPMIMILYVLPTTNSRISEKPPVGILRNSSRFRDERNFQVSRNGREFRKSLSVAPKTVKIDERFWPTEKDSKTPPPRDDLYRYYSGLNGPPRITICPGDIGPTGTHGQNGHTSLNSAVKCKITAERIDLTETPYSSETGQNGIPLRLMQRYAHEVGADLVAVATALEEERQCSLRRVNRPVVSFLDQIQSSQFLNCEGIKTGSISDFLTGLGLPMYINRIKEFGPFSQQTTTTSTSTGPSPVKLLQMTDHELVHLIGFTPHHVAWLRHEASSFPWSLLLAQPYSIECGEGRMTSLSRSGRSRKLTEGSSTAPYSSLGHRPARLHGSQKPFEKRSSRRRDSLQSSNKMNPMMKDEF